MADMDPPKQPLESLTAMLHLMLKETGKFFRAAHSKDLKQISVTKTAISQAIPAANQRFHEALDELEVEIIKAKSVFERDLSSIRARRAERQRAAGMLKTPNPNGVAKNGGPAKSPIKNPVSSAPSPKSELAPQVNGPDVPDKSNSDVHPPTNEVSLDQADQLDGNTLLLTDATSKEEPTVSKLPNQPQSAAGNPKGPASPTNLTSVAPEAPMLATDIVKQPDTLASTGTTNPHPPDKSTTTPTTTAFADAQFESMFNEDPITGNDAADLDFDLGFPSTNDDRSMLSGDAAELLSGSALQDMGVGGDTTTKALNIGAPNSSNNEDINTLLPGLENYVNAANDFSLISNGATTDPLLTTAATTTTANNAEQQQQQNTTTSDIEQPAIESNFDDLFGFGSYMDGNDDDELGGLGGMGEVPAFDDEWFKTDVM
ncbi:MAG: hypothetical protein Q9167_004231 [Letrouitia subvulpina]